MLKNKQELGVGDSVGVGESEGVLLLLIILNVIDDGDVDDIITVNAY